MLKPLEEWEKIYELVIIDYDGFDRSDPKLMEKGFTKEEFKKGMFTSTIMDRNSNIENPVIMIFKVHYDGNWCAFDKLDEAFIMFEAELDNDNDEVEIEIDYMRKNTFENLPEFQG